MKKNILTYLKNEKKSQQTNDHLSIPLQCLYSFLSKLFYHKHLSL